MTTTRHIPSLLDAFCIPRSMPDIVSVRSPKSHPPRRGHAGNKAGVQTRSTQEQSRCAAELRLALKWNEEIGKILSYSYALPHVFNPDFGSKWREIMGG